MTSSPTDDEPADGRPNDTVPPEAMLVRQWVIAANFRMPSEYDIPSAPRFRREYCEDGGFALCDPTTGEQLLTADSSYRVRR